MLIYAIAFYSVFISVTFHVRKRKKYLEQNLHKNGKIEVNFPM